MLYADGVAMSAEDRTHWLAENRLELGLSDDEILWAGRLFREDEAERDRAAGAA